MCQLTKANKTDNIYTFKHSWGFEMRMGKPISQLVVMLLLLHFVDYPGGLESACNNHHHHYHA